MISFSIDKKRSEIFFATLCILFYLTRTSIPFFKYLFILIFGGIYVYISINYKDRILENSKNLLKSLTLSIILILYLIIAFFLSDKIYLIVVKEIIDIFFLLASALVLNIFINNTDDFRLFYKYFINLIIVFAIIISIERIYYFIYSLTYVEYFNLTYINPYKASVDRNFALLPVIFGMLAILSYYLEKTSKLKLLVSNIILLLFSISFLLSGSRRGVFVFSSILIFVIIIQVYNLFSNNLKLKQFCKNSKYFILTFFSTLLLLVIVFSTTSIYFKNKALEAIGVKNISFTKNKLSSTLTRYIHFLSKDFTEDYVYSKIWDPVFDPKDPETSPGNGNYKIVKNLCGNNVDIVPKGAKGYLLDSTCLGFASQVHSYYFLEIKNEKVDEGDSLIISVFCYVSNDFDGDAVAIRIIGSVKSNPDKYFDLNNKGSWQKLELPISCNKGKISINLYMAKSGVKDFSKLKGHVIFAYPEIQSAVKYNSNENINKQFNKSKLIPSKINIKNIKSEGKIGNEIFQSGILLKELNIKSFFIIYNDPIRNWISKIVSEDTTYHGFKSKLIFSKPKDNFAEDRIVLWNFAFEIFNKEYNWVKKIFGGGFNFLNWYGACFTGDRTKTYYPHNPFLHILLYSGIVGLLIYIFFISQVFYYYIKYIKEYPLLFIFFIITFFFTFFSGSNPFDPPVMGFFVILPFLIHFYHTK
ncbi:MAG TPA: O-antigen ligase family protein [Bacteroidales bacterium]|nr:O-antigen ligase family protein [Bacteroidales bacterium]HOU95418.1 O-antigen ligase family protein [Bacteroidales bacterium]HQG36303.1 O-antigen ligase family protein [Bacteroidales bacterium]HQG52513.1 O-antigen ligase family protein [Bacteroidales bacterium]HQJ20064.1 O-antigen ligase family protein [Bacteroidales bacterium]